MPDVCLVHLPVLLEEGREYTVVVSVKAWSPLEQVCRPCEVFVRGMHLSRLTSSIGSLTRIST